VPERLRPLVAALALLVLAGCGSGEPEAASSPVAPTVSATSAGPSSAVPTPTPSSAAPSSPSSASASPSPTPTRTASATPEDGAYATDLSLSEDGALSYAPLRWYTGDNAAARCQAKKVKPEGAWCTDYYYEEAGDRKAAALTEATKVRLLDDDSKPADASLTDLVQAIEDEVWPNYQLVVSGGRVTQITQVFTP
jgi:hypothetical protein